MEGCLLADAAVEGTKDRAKKPSNARKSARHGDDVAAAEAAEESCAPFQ